jgi:hypothetical protein
LCLERACVDDFQGAVLVELDGAKYVAVRTDAVLDPPYISAALIIGAPSLEDALSLLDRLEAKREELAGASVRAFGTSLGWLDVPLVPESDLVLPEPFKQDLLSYLDAFWRGAPTCQALRIAPSRGVLFVGQPGTGKSLVIRHLMERYHTCRRFVFAPEVGSRGSTDSPFGELVKAVAWSRSPALAVIEDIDRLFESGTVTPQFFLNVLDGLLQPKSPVLWIATSNDPRALADNVLDRPGRFDRVFVFPVPEKEERARLIARYSPWPVLDSTVEDLASESAGLTAAHLREACYSAALEVGENRAWYGNSLRKALARVREQHERAGRYDYELRQVKAGFGR